jgi:putative ABC transport system substrate-binding protein
MSLRGLLPGDGLLPPDARTINIPGIVLDLQRSAKVPAVFEAAFWVQAGAVISYGSDDYADGVQAASLVAKILRGARTQDLPVEGANKIELAVNLKTARSVGMTIPDGILTRADRILE